MAILQSKARNDEVLADHLINGKSNAKYTSPDIQNELLGICAQQIIESIVSDCMASGYFAIMADEATDSSTKEQLSICLRFISKNEDKHIVREEFLGFVTCDSIKGQDLTQGILEHLQKVGLGILKIRGQCYDGAGNMVGKYKGVQALVRERVPLAHYIHCKSHCLNLSLVHSSKLPCVRTMMSTVQDIAFAFEYSAKRLTAFTDELSEDVPIKEAMEGRRNLKTLCETRWMSRAESLFTFKSAFRVIVHSLERLQDDGDTKASEYLNAILQFQFIVVLVATEHILGHLVGLTAELQEVNMDLLEAIEQTKVVMQIYRTEREDDQVWDTLYQQAVAIAADFQIEPCVPRQVVRQRNRANYGVEEPSRYWKVSFYFVFLDHLLQELDTRIMKNEERFQAQWLISTKIDGLVPAGVNRLFNVYEPDLTRTLEEFREEVRRWLVRWQLQAAKPSTLLETLNSTSHLAYPSIYTILKILLTMPATSASCERSFIVQQ